MSGDQIFNLSTKYLTRTTVIFREIFVIIRRLRQVGFSFMTMFLKILCNVFHLRHQKRNRKNNRKVFTYLLSKVRKTIFCFDMAGLRGINGKNFVTIFAKDHYYCFFNHSL